MMLEFWWKAFIIAIIIAIVAKIFGSTWSVFMIFAVSFIAAAIGLIVLVVVGEAVVDWFKRQRKNK